MNWIPITDIDQLNAIDEASNEKPVLIFKHSTRCSISSAALNRLESSWTNDDNAQQVYFLDLIRFRQISNAIAEHYGIVHESPQTLVILNGKCVDVNAHFSITYKNTIEALIRVKTA